MLANPLLKIIAFAFAMLIVAHPLHAETRWGAFVLGVDHRAAVASALVAKNAKILEEGAFSPTRGSYLLAMAIPDDPHVLSSKFIFDQNDRLVGIFSKYPGEMFTFASENFGKMYKIAWVEYGFTILPT